MKILAVDIGTGTQDIFLYDSQLDLENGFKLVLPSPTMMARRRIQQATRAGKPVLLSGVTMGGGPCAWAAEAHARAGLAMYATPEAARTLDDDLERVAAAGIRVVSQDEADRLPDEITRIRMADFDFEAIRRTLERFEVPLDDLAAVAVAVFDHGAAPPGVSDRQFRFDYLDERIRLENRLSAFAYLSGQVPPAMTRLEAVAGSAAALDCPLLVMDTAPAAVLGATFDPGVARRERKLVVNLGNFHALAFRLGGEGNVEGLFEHHTGEIDFPKLAALIRKLADGSLKHADVFDDMGHGALIYSEEAFPFGQDDFDVVVTGPRRAMFNRNSSTHNQQPLRPYFAVPFGDMMLAGCFGLLAAAADLLPGLAGQLHASLAGGSPGLAPWDVGNQA
jgi:uncharacterized protein (DUF1786 family)